MIQVPRKWIYNMTGAQATQLMVDWDKAMDAINDLMGFPLNRGKETMYCQTDVILRSSVHAPGYPAVNVTSNVNSEVSPAGYANNYLVRGPGAIAHRRQHRVPRAGPRLRFPEIRRRDRIQRQPAPARDAAPQVRLQHSMSPTPARSATASVHHRWTTPPSPGCACFSFSPNEIPMRELEKQYQLKGHAKFMDIARLLRLGRTRCLLALLHGGRCRRHLLCEYRRRQTAAPLPQLSARTSGRCSTSGASTRRIPPRSRPPSRRRTSRPRPRSVNCSCITRSLVPADNAAFRTFCLNWWGTQTQRRRRIGRKPTTPCSGMKPWMPTGPTIPTSGPHHGSSMSKPAPPRSAPASMNSSTSISPSASPRSP